MSLPITINGTDFSHVLEYAGRTETYRKVEGGLGGTAKNGDDIYDDLGEKFDLATRIKPCRPSELASLITVLRNSTVTVSYFSFMRNQTVTQTMRASNLEAVLAMLRLWDNEVILGNIDLYLRQK